jgi:predicted transcriptional regulator
MHDLHLANQIVKLARKHAKGRPVKTISLELGDILEHGENITSENLKYNINLLLPDVSVNIKKIEGDSWRLIEINI